MFGLQDHGQMFGGPLPSLKKPVLQSGDIVPAKAESGSNKKKGNSSQRGVHTNTKNRKIACGRIQNIDGTRMEALGGAG